jgi:hypothetical protein
MLELALEAVLVPKPKLVLAVARLQELEMGTAPKLGPDLQAAPSSPGPLFSP